MTILTILKNGTAGKRLRRLIRLYHAHGSGRIVYTIARRIVALPLLRNCCQLCAVDLWRLPLAGAQPSGRTPTLLTIRPAQQNDFEQLSNYFGNPRRVEQRLTDGNQCVLAVSQRSIGAAVWLATGPGQFTEDWCDLRCCFRFPRRVAWAFDGKGTRLGAWGILMKQVPTLLREQGVDEIATIIDCNNWQSIDAHHSLGYEQLGTLLHVRLVGLSMRLFKPRTRWWQRVPKKIGPVELSRTEPEQECHAGS